MHLLVMKLALGQLRQKPLARVMAVSSAVTVLVMNGLLGVLFQAVGASSEDLKATHSVLAYLDDTASVPAMVSAINKVPGVRSSEAVSRAEFAKRYAKVVNTAAVTDGMDEDVIPQYVKVKLQSSDPRAVAKAIEKLKGVEFTELATAKTSNVVGALAGLQGLLALLMVILTVALFSVLVNHFKLSTQLALQTRKTLTGLGARKSLIMFPAFVEGAVEGAVSGVLASLLFLGLSAGFGSKLAEAAQALGLTFHQQATLPIAAVIAVAGTALGVAGSLWTIRRVR